MHQLFSGLLKILKVNLLCISCTIILWFLFPYRWRTFALQEFSAWFSNPLLKSYLALELFAFLYERRFLPFILFAYDYSSCFPLISCIFHNHFRKSWISDWRSLVVKFLQYLEFQMLLRFGKTLNFVTESYGAVLLCFL